MQAYRNRTGCRRYPTLTVDELLEALLPDPSADLPCLDTPYSKYSNTNYSASGQDLHAINRIVQQRHAQLDDVTAELAAVESIMKRVCDVHQRLHDKRKQIVASMEAHQGLISCIRRLPTEILGEIFVRCLPSEMHIEPNMHTAPLLLTRVCRAWRKVALRTPTLWCSLSVRPSQRGQQSLFFYHHWLSRARGCPLSLAVDTRRPPKNPVWRYEVTELLQPYMSRSVRLHVIFDDPTAADLLLKDVPILEHLTLEGNLGENQKIVVVQPEAEPRLRGLTLDLLTFSVDTLSALSPGWTDLRRLCITVCHATQQDVNGSIALILTLCPHLEELSFSPMFSSRNRDVAPRAVTHTQLRSLDLVVLYGVGCLLDTLTLPALRHLKIRDLDILPSAWRNDEFKTFVMRSRCPLETLKIHTQVSIKEDRAAYVALLPTLTQLDLCLWRSSDRQGYDVWGGVDDDVALDVRRRQDATVDRSVYNYALQSGL